MWSWSPWLIPESLWGNVDANSILMHVNGYTSAFQQETESRRCGGIQMKMCKGAQSLNKLEAGCVELDDIRNLN